MSDYRPHQRGGGRRRYHQRDDYEDRKREETPEQKTRSAIIKLGEVDAVEELPRLAAQLAQPRHRVPAIAEGFRIGVTEQPYKIPYYAALLHLLHQEVKPKDEGEEEHASFSSLGAAVLDDFWRGFQGFLDKLAWREIRCCIQFFAHLTEAGIVAPDSMVSLLQSFTAVLDEFGASYGRAKRAALCAAEGLMIAGYTIKQADPDKATSMIEAIQSYNDGIITTKWIVQPDGQFSNEQQASQCGAELLECVLSALKELNALDFTTTFIPRPYCDYPSLSSAEFSYFRLPSILVAPEVIEVETISTSTGEEIQVKKEEWPEYLLKLFDSAITPAAETAPGYFVKSALIDIVTIFEVNRKECARLLLEYPKWTVPGTFKPKPGVKQETSGAAVENNWELESTIIEIIIGAYLRLPETSHTAVYYVTLVTDLCKLSPSTVGPAVGKTIRKLYGLLSDGLDVDLSRRFTEWFSIHMSNFGFAWVWKEWIPDLNLDRDHPRRHFMRRAVELEVRLAYHDRVLKTLPEPMQDPEAAVISAESPGPNFVYDEPGKPHYDAAQTILNLLRSRTKAEEVVEQLDVVKQSMETSEDEHIADVDGIIRSIVVQSLLSVGARSFSHLLNALERYLVLLRHISSSSEGVPNKEAKADILSATSVFWKNNQQMVGIVYDKLMQYQIVDPADVITWAFERGHDSDSGLRSTTWDLLKGAIDKANGRVIIATRKLNVLRKEDEERRDRAKANAGGAMEVDGDVKPVDEKTDAENAALTNAVKAVDSLVREQKFALSSALDGFVNRLTSPTSAAPKVILQEEWARRDSWGSSEWIGWEAWGWYRQFCRFYAPYLRNYQATLSTVSFAKLETATDPSSELVKRIWNVATGQEP
ncbi:MIF4G like-domain-containing protein [Pterulicium gracile]|uniref:MIF4G like-domain-containing protein n=1 Tax=Pterulicium gracile TaxID=1884261 RepID=A0A5C3QTW1_9AGAR|nr:MIF4G like-domain-containing protein [Pterula gracilis]